jgi:hypothetical protein
MLAQRMVVVFLAALFTGGSALADPIQIDVYTALAPNGYGPSFGSWASNAVYALENGLSAYGTPGTPAYFSETTTVDSQDLTVTNFPSWMGTADPGAVFGPDFANEEGNRGTFPLFIDGGTGAPDFSIAELNFTVTSSDAYDSLGGSFIGGYTYGDGYVGGIWNPGTSTITYVTGGDPTQMVNFLWGRGSGNGLWPCGPGDTSPCDTPAEQQADIDATAAILEGQTLTGTYWLTDSGGNTLATGSATFDIASPEPTTLFLLGGGLLLLGGLGYRRRA